VDVPDWDLARRLVDLLAPYASGLTGGSFRIEAADGRGSYSAETVEELRSEIELRGEKPRELALRISGMEEEAGVLRGLSVVMEADRSFVRFASGDEAVVDHLYARSRALIEQAAARRAERETVEHEQQAQQAKQTQRAARAALAAPPTSARSGWRKLMHDPNPWLLFIGGGAVAAVIAGVVLWIVIG
jgi:hypothetical protein